MVHLSDVHYPWCFEVANFGSAEALLAVKTEACHLHLFAGGQQICDLLQFLTLAELFLVCRFHHFGEVDIVKFFVESYGHDCVSCALEFLYELCPRYLFGHLEGATVVKLLFKNKFRAPELVFTILRHIDRWDVSVCFVVNSIIRDLAHPVSRCYFNHIKISFSCYS